MRGVVLLLSMFFSSFSLYAQIHSVKRIENSITDSVVLNNGKHRVIDEGNCRNETTPYTPLEYSTPSGPVQFGEYIKADVFLTKDEKAEHIVYIRQNFTDQFLEIYDSEKMLPASRIHGFYLDKRFFRSINHEPKRYYFAEQIVEGKINLFHFKEIPIWEGTIELMGSKSGSSGYRNEMIIGNNNWRTYGTKDIFYISKQSKHDKLIKVDPGTFAGSYLYDCPKARKEMERMKKSEGNKAYKVLGGLGFAYSIIVLPSALSNMRQGRQDDKNRALFTIGIGAVSTYLLFKNSKSSSNPKPDEMIEIINIYNNCSN